jgi:uncharacterized protein
MTSTLKIRVVPSMGEIDAAAWDACANPAPAGLDRLEADATAQPAGCLREISGEGFNPFITHGFLHALESSGSVGGRTGWRPAHILVEDAGRLVAAAPTYLKTHSLGEYVFDHGWADAYHRAGLDYYPKVQVAVPFTPVTGRRLLVAPAGGNGAREALLLGLRHWREKICASSVHVTFPTREEWEALRRAGFLQRTGQQFHFVNKGYKDFEAFLSDLAARKRKMIRRERKEALAGGIEVELLTGTAIKEAHWDAFFGFYMDTGARKWGRPYLTRAFFSEIGATMEEHILLVMANRARRPIAGALNFIGRDALYGRYWGAIEEHPFLHFEVCYYQAIDYAIVNGLSRVEAGAQGEHKLARGYVAVPTYSAHEIADRRFASAIDAFLAEERVAIEESLEDYAELAPFKKG